MAFDDHFFPLFGLEVKAHTNGVRFGMKLRTDHIVRKADGHDGAFKRYMRPVFFNTQYLAAKVPQAVVVRLYHLVIPTVYRIKWIVQAFKGHLVLTFYQHMHGEYAKCGRLSLGNLADLEMPAGQLEGVADEKDMFLLQVGRIVVPFNHLL